MLGRVKLDNTLLTCNKGNFYQITRWSRIQALVTMVRDTCSTTVPPAAPKPVSKSMPNVSAYDSVGIEVSELSFDPTYCLCQDVSV